MQHIKTKSNFPSHAVPLTEKMSMEYGSRIGKAIEDEWFSGENGATRYFSLKDNYHRLRLYARGEQSIQKYRDELAINGDLSYLNVDWKPVPIIPKFVDILVNGITDRPWGINAFSQDPFSVNKRIAYMEAMLEDMNNKALYETIDSELGINMFNNPVEAIPEDIDELTVNMQLEYKESIEIAEEEVIMNVFSTNKYENVRNRSVYDLVVLGIGVERSTFNPAEGILTQYVDPVDVVYSYSDCPYFSDIYYVGEVRKMPISGLKKNFPHLTNDDVKEIEDTMSGNPTGVNTIDKDLDSGYVYVLNFEYKTYEDRVHKIKVTSTGAEKAIEKDDTFNPPEDKMENFLVNKDSIEMIYCGAKIIGHDKMLKWGRAVNISRPKSNITRANFSYNIVCPKMYQGRPDSMVERMTTYADSICVTQLKLQLVRNRMIPDGVFIDVDGLSDVSIGEGIKYEPQDALNMFFQTGSVIGRSMTVDGEFNHGRVPVQEITSSSSIQKIQSLISLYNHDLQMIRDVTGLNEARDGSKPDKDMLVGLQKMAAASSNTATRHITDASEYLTLRMAECVSLRVSDVMEYSNNVDAFINSIGRFNMASLTEVKDLHLHDFGIFLEVEPDYEDKQSLQQDISYAIQNGLISLSDKYDIMDVKNIKLARQLLKVRKRKKEEQDRKDRLENISYQAEANGKSAERAAAADAQKEQAIAASKGQLRQLEHQLEKDRMELELQHKKEFARFQYEIDANLKKIENDVTLSKEGMKEDRKDKRTELQATQQSKLINQRQNELPPQDFSQQNVAASFDEVMGQ